MPREIYIDYYYQSLPSGIKNWIDYHYWSLASKIIQLIYTLALSICTTKIIDYYT